MKISLACLLLSFPVGCFSAPSIKATLPESKTPSPAVVDRAKAENFRKASELLGMDVRDLQEKKLGDVRDVVVEIVSGRIVYVVMAPGSVLKLENKLLALPPGLFRPSTATALLLDSSAELLEKAPAFGKNSWPDFADKSYEQKVTAHYGRKGSGKITPGSSERRLAATWVRGAHNTNELQISEAAGSSRRDYVNAPIKVSELIGVPVQGARGEKLGEVKDLLLDLPAGRIVYSVLGTGGLLGFNSRLHAVPLTALNASADGRFLKVEKTKKDFESLVTLPSGRWPGKPEGSWGKGSDLPAEKVGREIRESSGTLRSTRDPSDNRARIVPDRGELTASDQSESRSDRELTRRLRRELMREHSLSFLTKNIKIITVNGEVTLRGRVKNQAELDIILARAHDVAGAAHVNNRLEMKNSAAPLPSR